jgi:hypothetical protein
MILASAMLAGSLLATGAQARGSGGGGGHMGGFGGGHMGSFGGGRIGGLGGEHLGGGDHLGHDHFGAGRRLVFGGGVYDDGLDCPYYRSHTWPDTCTY